MDVEVPMYTGVCDVIHLAPSGSVTGSAHLLQTLTGVTLLVDCGLAQGHDEQAPISNWPVKPSEIDVLFITHAHLDHIGRIPDLIDAGFDGEIICTHPTARLILPMLDDAMGFTNRSKHEIGRLRNKIDQMTWGFEYDEVFSLSKGITFKLGNAGHILGSCFITFVIPNPDGDDYTVIFSGDLGGFYTPILPDPSPPGPCDLLVLESTYGHRNHHGRKERVENLEGLLLRALSDKGKVFIPAFSLGRTQELIYEMDRIFSSESWRVQCEILGIDPHPPVFVDSPLGLEITAVYSDLELFWDKEAKALNDSGDHPIDFSHLYSVERYRAHKQLLEMPGPAVIMAGSGMCTGGRILDHLENGLEDPRNDVFFVGYQARGTLGRQIIKYSKRPGGYAKINGEKIPIKARVHNLSGYSAHADQGGLVAWVKSMGSKPGRIRLVHGESEAQSALREVLTMKGYQVEEAPYS